MRKRHKPALFAGLAATLLLAGRPVTAEDGGAMLPLKEFMAHVMQRNATQLWSWSAWISDEHGDRYTSPHTAAEWENAESDALSLVELAQRLKVDERRIDASWDGFADALAVSARRSAEAAERHDLDGLIGAGNDLADRCVACHLHYVPELEGAPARTPAAAQGAEKGQGRTQEGRIGS